MLSDRDRQRLTAAQARAQAQATPPADRWGVTWTNGLYQPFRCASGRHATRAAAQADADSLNWERDLKEADRATE
jgi:hypothetical protein